jgi:hypothetical protein
MKIEYLIFALLGLIAAFSKFYLGDKKKETEWDFKFIDWGVYLIMLLGLYGLIMAVISLF